MWHIFYLVVSTGSIIQQHENYGTCYNNSLKYTKVHTAVGAVGTCTSLHTLRCKGFYLLDAHAININAVIVINQHINKYIRSSGLLLRHIRHLPRDCCDVSLVHLGYVQLMGYREGCKHVAEIKAWQRPFAIVTSTWHATENSCHCAELLQLVICHVYIP